MSDQAIMELNLLHGDPHCVRSNQALKPTKPMRLPGGTRDQRPWKLWLPRERLSEGRVLAIKVPPSTVAEFSMAPRRPAGGLAEAHPYLSTHSGLVPQVCSLGCHKHSPSLRCLPNPSPSWWPRDSLSLAIKWLLTTHHVIPEAGEPLGSLALN